MTSETQAPIQSPPVTQNRSRWWPWQVCGFLLVAIALSYLDRMALSVVGKDVANEMALDNARLGLLFSAFFWAYGLMHVPAGWLLDRYNIRFSYPLFVIFWSLSQIGAGLARSFGGLFAARLSLGAFESAGQPGAARIVARLFAGKDRALANGLMMSGGSLGAMIAGPLMIGLSNTVGWRMGFVVIGTLGLVWAAGWLFWFRPPSSIDLAPRGAVQEPAHQDRWDVILSAPKFWACVSGALFCIPIIHISSSWVPTYFRQQWGLEMNRDLALSLLLIYMGLDLGFLLGGAAVRFLIHRGLQVGAAQKRILLVATLFMLSIVAVPWVPTPWAAVVLVLLTNMGRAAYGAIFLAFNQDIAAGRVGTLAGVMGSIGSLSGALLIWLIGIVSNIAGGFTLPFLVMGVLAVLGVLPLLLVHWDGKLAGMPTRESARSG
jgi:ACS family D-galactonate transporter-like MFS transporter